MGGGLFMRVRNESGGSLVEFAIISPLLFIILFGIIEFAVLLYDKAMITNASREGARAGIVFNFDSSGPTRISDDEIRAIVGNYCATHLISFGSGSTLTIPITRTGSQEGASLTVTVDYPYRFLVFSNLIALFGGDVESPLNLRAVSVMRLE
jgi:Flp pilus assembly protein TadG